MFRKFTVTILVFFICLSTILFSVYAAEKPVTEEVTETVTEEVMGTEKSHEDAPFSEKIEIDGVIVRVEADEGVIPAGTILEVKEVTSKEEKKVQKLLSEVREKNVFSEDDLDLDEIKSLIEKVKGFGSCLFVSDQKVDDLYIRKANPDEIGDVQGEFNCVVINLNKTLLDMKDDEITFLFLRIIDKVKIGGLIFIPESTYQYIPHGRVGAEALIQVLGLNIELPLHRLGKMVIASKR